MIISDTNSVMKGISRNERLRNGIFFTSLELVKEIQSHIHFDGIKSVIDSAAGSGHFLISLAEQYPDIDFYGVEKHSGVYQKSKRKLQQFPNIHYFCGDILTDTFPIPRCDLYLGNPPFINFTDLEKEYRERIRPLWQKYLKLQGGFSLLLGHSRADISQLIFQKTLEDYLNPGAQLGVILPDSLLWGDASMGGFQKTQGFSIKLIKETPDQNAFDGTNRNSFYVVGKKGEETQFPVTFIRKNGKTEYINREEGKWRIGKKETSLLPGHWKGHYRARQGINTLGANKIFFFKEKPDLEDDLLYPLLRSSDLYRWGSNPQSWCLVPYRDGELLDIEILEEDYPETWKYLQNHKSLLKARKSRFAQKHWHALFGIGPYSFAPYRVTWRALGARKMEAAVVSRGMANQSMHCFIPCRKQDEAYYLAGLLNSPIMGKEIQACTKAGSMSFGQPGILSRLHLPPLAETKEKGIAIAKLSRKLHHRWNPSQEEELFTLIAQLLEA